MYPIRRILVALKLDEQDACTLRYAAMLSRLLKPQRVYFAHIAESLDIPPSIRRQFPQVAATPEDTIHADLDREVRRHFEAPGNHEVIFDVSEGSPVFELLRLIRRHDIDLVITGRAMVKAESGGVPDKLARKAPCTVLVVPEGSEASLRHIVAPVDFHNDLHIGFEESLELARCAAPCQITCLNVYRVPIGYHRSGKTYEQFAEIMKQHAEAAYTQFLKRFDTSNLTVRPWFERADGSTAEAIDRVLRHLKPHLVVMAGRGRQEGAGLVLGSTTERMIWRTSVPLMAVKGKGVGLSFLDALLNL